MATNMVSVFPFLLLHPRTTVTAEHASVASRAWLKRALLYVALRADGSVNVVALYFLMLTFTLFAIALMSYYLLTLCSGFPFLGRHYRTVCILKDTVSILLLRSLCGYYLVPNPAKDTAHGGPYADLEGFVPGVFTCVRRAFYRCVLRSADTPRDRWFSSFTGDHILLFMVGGAYVVAYALFPILYWEDGRQCEQLACSMRLLWGRITVVFQTAQGIYLATFLVGFLYCTLEHSAHFRPGAERGARAHLLCFLALWLPQFLLFYRIHKDLEERHAKVLEKIFEALRAMPQIFITHSAAMVGAIALGHHQHFHRCQDLSWKASVFLVMCVAGYAVSCTVEAMAESGALHPEKMRYAFVLAEVFTYVAPLVRLTMGSISLSWVRLHMHDTDARTLPGAWALGDVAQSYAEDVRRSITAVVGDSAGHGRPGRLRLSTRMAAEEEIAWDHLRSVLRQVSAPDADAASGPALSDGHAGGDGHSASVGHGDEGAVSFMDYDCALVMITFCAMLLHPICSLFGHYSMKEWFSWVITFLTILIFPVSLSLFVMVAWIQNPAKSNLLKVVLWLGLFTSICAVSDRSAVEVCLVKVAHDPYFGPMECCRYPGFYDFNARRLKIVGRGYMSVAELCNRDIFMDEGHHGGQRREMLVPVSGPSAAFFFLQLVGAVGQVEFFFTLVGLFFKLILRLPFSRKKRRAGATPHHILAPPQSRAASVELPAVSEVSQRGLLRFDSGEAQQ